MSDENQILLEWKINSDQNIVRIIHLGYYFSRRGGHADELSNRLLQFKDASPFIVNKWCKLACNELSKNKIKFHFAVRVLSSTEKIANSGTPLDQLGIALVNAKIVDKYDSQRLTKKSITTSLKKLGKSARKQALDHLYTFTVPNEVLPPNPKILIIDDVTTTGSSLCEVARAIKEKLPTAQVHGFVLLHTENIEDKYEGHNKKVFESLENSSVVNKVNSSSEQQAKVLQLNKTIQLPKVTESVKTAEPVKVVDLVKAQLPSEVERPIKSTPPPIEINQLSTKITENKHKKNLIVVENGNGATVFFAFLVCLLLLIGLFFIFNQVELSENKYPRKSPSESVKETSNNYLNQLRKTMLIQGIEFDWILVEGGPNGDYYISATEVTCKQYGEFCNSTGYKKPKYLEFKETYPVVNVNLYDTQKYCKWLSKIIGRTIRLPSETEWDFAYKGGNKSMSYKYSGSNNADEVAWYSINSDTTFHDVATKKPNELGIYDMSGNVWEWCGDNGTIRGGSFGNGVEMTRSIYQTGTTINDRFSSGGFRIVMEK